MGIQEIPHALFQVAVKVIVRRDGKILVLRTQSNRVDFPGGRMDEAEVDLPLNDILQRELVEELGSNVELTEGKLAFVARRKYDHDNVTHHILAIYYDTTYISGEIQLSDEHIRSSWLEPEELLELEQDFIAPDEYQQFRQYLA